MPPWTREGHSWMSTFLGKKRWCRNDKNGPLENVHFVLENIGEQPSNVSFSRCQSTCFRMSIIPKGIRVAIGRLPFFTRRGSNFLRMWIILKEKRGPTWTGLARDLRGTCEGTDSGERDKCKKNRDEGEGEGEGRRTRDEGRGARGEGRGAKEKAKAMEMAKAKAKIEM